MNVNPIYNREEKSIPEKTSCPKILIVDDDEFNIKALTLLLETFKFTRDFALNGKKAIEMIVKQTTKQCQCRYQLILLDCNMPVMNGYQTCRKLKAMI